MLLSNNCMYLCINFSCSLFVFHPLDLLEKFHFKFWVYRKQFRLELWFLSMTLWSMISISFDQYDLIDRYLFHILTVLFYSWEMLVLALAWLYTWSICQILLSVFEADYLNLMLYGYHLLQGLISFSLHPVHISIFLCMCYLVSFLAFLNSSEYWYHLYHVSFVPSMFRIVCITRSLWFVCFAM